MQEPFMPITMPSDDDLVKLSNDEVVTWGELRKRMEKREPEWIKYLFGEDA